MKTQIEITNWAVSASGGPYTAPECRVAVLLGEIDSHPDVEVVPGDNKVRTSPIHHFIGRNVFTQNSFYLLVGEPAQYFLDFLAVKNLPYDPQNPLKVLADAGYLPKET